MTSPTIIYLDRDKSSRTNTSNCPSRVRLTKKRNYLPPPGSRGDKRRAFRCRSSGSNRSTAIDNRKVSEKVSNTNLLAYTQRRETYTRLEAECTYIFTITPRSLLSLHNFIVILASGPGSTCRWQKIK